MVAMFHWAFKSVYTLRDKYRRKAGRQSIKQWALIISATGKEWGSLGNLESVVAAFTFFGGKKNKESE